MLCGTYEVFENRRSGRTISLDIAVLPAKKKPLDDPLFFLSGGPGGSATVRAEAFRNSWIRKRRDIVLIDQRGTGGSNPLPCDMPGSSDDLQGYLAGDFSDVGLYRRCKNELGKLAALEHYTTPNTVDDLDEVREAMGYERVNLLGSSWGTRTALVYLRRHPESVRSAILSSSVPLGIVYPLYHAQGAQGAFETVLAQCSADSACSSAFPDPAADLAAALDRLAAGPLAVTIEHPDTGEPVEVQLSQQAFREGLRYFHLSVALTRWIPLILDRAAGGDFSLVAQLAVEMQRSFRPLKIGLLASIACSGDVPRIDPADIPPLTDGTFYGERRVRETLAICDVWPTGRLDPSFGDPVSGDHPVLLWAGSLDSASRPEWGLEVTDNYPNGLPLVIEGGHTPEGSCVDKVNKKFLTRASVKRLKTGCTRRVSLPGFVVP
jgi:pimeloyl-ACP methyl ester carboxylesterase